ncbi:MAG: hypothetical protein IT369_18240 [Candidatus Latescibacteria bacterium]|nr:hypothetical protein [Candidatus Latescibacterota bacterium]
MRIIATLGLAALVFAAGCSDRDSTAPTAPEPAGKLVVSKTKAGGMKGRPRTPGGPTTGLLKMEELRYDRPIVVERTTGKVQLQLEEIQDSRCAEGVTCIWAGEAKVTILAQDEGETQPHRLVLTLGDPKASQGKTGKFAVQLFAVNPYPKADAPTAREDYAVMVGVLPIGEEGQIITY